MYRPTEEKHEGQCLIIMSCSISRDRFSLYGDLVSETTDEIYWHLQSCAYKMVACALMILVFPSFSQLFAGSVRDVTAFLLQSYWLTGCDGNANGKSIRSTQSVRNETVRFTWCMLTICGPYSSSTAGLRSCTERLLARRKFQSSRVVFCLVIVENCEEDQKCLYEHIITL